MDSAKVGIFEEGDQISLSSLLEGQNGLTLEADFLFELSGNLSHQSLEGELPDEQVSLNKQSREKQAQYRRIEHAKNTYAFLELADLSQSNSSRFETVRFLNAGDDRGRLAGDLLRGELFAGHLLGSGLAGSLFCAGHHQ